MAAAEFPAALQVYWHKGDPSLGVCTVASAQEPPWPPRHDPVAFG